MLIKRVPDLFLICSKVGINYFDRSRTMFNSVSWYIYISFLSCADDWFSPDDIDKVFVENFPQTRLQTSAYDCMYMARAKNRPDFF